MSAALVQFTATEQAKIKRMLAEKLFEAFCPGTRFEEENDIEFYEAAVDIVLDNLHKYKMSRG